jgi:hypothetical protein
MIQIHAFEEKEKEDPNSAAYGKSSNVWWPLKGSNVWWPMEGFNA